MEASTPSPAIQCTEEGCSWGKRTRIPENFYTFICKIKLMRLRIKCLVFKKLPAHVLWVYWMVAELVASCSTTFPQFPPILLAHSLGHTAPFPSPCPGKDLSLCRQQPAQARKKERKQELAPHLQRLFLPPPTNKFQSGIEY